MDESIDHLRRTGLLTLGSRLRRLGERVQGDTQEILGAWDSRVATPWHPLLNLLDHEGPQTIGQISAGLGLAQPGITRSVAGLEEIGLVRVTQSDTDRRLRHVALTEEGRDFVARARAEVWPLVNHAVADLCEGIGPELLEMIETLEDRLSDRPLRLRTGEDPS